MFRLQKSPVSQQPGEEISIIFNINVEDQSMCVDCTINIFTIIRTSLLWRQ
jgi:hypothetical protein